MRVGKTAAYVKPEIPFLTKTVFYSQGAKDSLLILASSSVMWSVSEKNPVLTVSLSFAKIFGSLSKEF
jgi:hypothetical protein